MRGLTTNISQSVDKDLLNSLYAQLLFQVLGTPGQTRRSPSRKKRKMLNVQINEWCQALILVMQKINSGKQRVTRGGCLARVAREGLFGEVTLN